MLDLDQLAGWLRGVDDPAPRQVGIDAMSHRNGYDGDSWLAACGNDLRFEFFAVLAAAPAQDGCLIIDSVHESTEKLSGQEVPMSSQEIIVDAWLLTPPCSGLRC